jgi:hypothetical protein
MRRAIAACILCVPALACAAGPTLDGRWAGRIEIPGKELPVVVDLARSPAGVWTGSIIIPGLGIKGAPLSNIVATLTDVAFDTGNLLAAPTYGPARFKAHLGTGEVMNGEMMQAGNTARISLKKIGPAQVDAPPRSTAVARRLEDRWIGEFELGGYPRHVTITLENHPDAAATAKFVVVGKQTTDLPVDLVLEEDKFVRIESQANRIAFEGRFIEESDEIRGAIDLGSLELPLVLRRSDGKTS